MLSCQQLSVCVVYTQLRSCTLCQGRAMCWVQSPQCLGSLHHSCSVLLQGSHEHSMVRVTDGNTECLRALKHTGTRIWSITAPWHTTSLKTTGFTSLPASPLWEVLCGPKGKWVGGRNGKKILWNNTFPCSCSGELCWSEKQTQWGCTQPAVCEPPKMCCPLSMATRSSHSASS